MANKKQTKTTRKKKTAKTALALAPIAPPAKLAPGTGIDDCIPHAIALDFRRELDKQATQAARELMADIPDDALGLFIRWRIVDFAGGATSAALLRDLKLYYAVMRPLLSDADELLSDMDGVGVLGGDAWRLHIYWPSIMSRRISSTVKWQQALYALENWGNLPESVLDGVPHGALRDVFERLRVISSEVYLIASETVWGGEAALAAATGDAANRSKGRVGKALDPRKTADALKIIQYARDTGCGIEEAICGAATKEFKPHANGDASAAHKKLRRWADEIREKKIIETLPSLGELAVVDETTWRSIKATIARKLGARA